MLVKRYGGGMTQITQLHEQIRSDFCDCRVHQRLEFELLPEYVKWLRSGAKCTTIRYRPDAIDVPADFDLPLLESAYNATANSQYLGRASRIGNVRITGMVIKPFAMLDQRDARRDGFSTKEDLVQALQRIYTPIYGAIDPDQYVSIYTIRLI